jgi:hypothetical protein
MVLPSGEFSGEERARSCILGAHRWRAVDGLERPINRERWVVPKYGAISGGVIEVGGLVKDFSSIGEDEEAVSEALGNPEKLEFSSVIAGFQVKASPFTEVRRTPTKINGDIPDAAGENANELSLRLSELVVKAAEDALGGEGLIVLRKLGRKAKGGECGRIEDFCEPASIIAKAAGLK